MRDLNAKRRRQTITHGAKPARGHPAVRQMEIEILCRPHLVLANLGGDVDIVATRHLAQTLDGMLRLYDLACLVEFQAVALAPGLNLRPPLVKRRLVRLEFAPFQLGQQRLDDECRIADYRMIDLHVLVDR